MTTSGLYTVDEVSAMIHEGKKLVLSGDDKLLSQLPKGDWIGACSWRFIILEQRIETHEKIFVETLPDFITGATIREYDAGNIKNIFNDGPKNGFTILTMPFGSPVAVEYITNAVNYENFAVHPVCGGISGDPFSPEKLVVASGTGPNIYTDKAVAMHVSLPENKFAEIHLFSPYKQGSGDSIKFDYRGLVLEDAYINGVKRNFTDYLLEIEYGPNSMPFVANYSGETISLIIGRIDGNKLTMVSPVFENIEYRMAVIDYSISEPTLIGDKIFFSASCITNYGSPEFCNRFLKKMNGPIVFGEIAYQMVGYTTVYLTIDDVQTEK